MKSTRRSIRHSCNTRGSLQHRGMHCPCRLENISMYGSLIRLKDSTCEPIQMGDACTLTIYKNPEKPAVHIATRVVHQGFTLVGLQFVDLDSEKIRCLGQLIEGIATSHA
ncbi:MAG: PilZ domain-containing protein [Desulfuromonadales bacterium]|nr:PilZ domain-containing protein [Desulfuromonadales bacterium]